ncbi:dead deah box helicase [Fusarium agapanthi]|uniref:Dead deah box helicase n=1 Tax=Fusarium agapanthi TaxID=1803897 RepID=A0A9P5B412_9HYPO|nr:dead deah box helicase [Fusarium agapanthi]
MLLAPGKAVGCRPWSRRVKQITFDEVHGIGQAKEHLHELKDRLTISPAQKAYDVDMIVHEVCNSGLRKLRCEPREEFVFQSLSVPWLDEDDSISPNFRLVHPVLALEDRNVFLLYYMNLEAQDRLASSRL